MTNNQAVTQAQLVSQPSMQSGKTTEQIALFDVSGAPITSATPAADTGATVLMTGYAAHAVGSVLATDSANVAMAKLEARIAALEA